MLSIITNICNGRKRLANDKDDKNNAIYDCGQIKYIYHFGKLMNVVYNIIEMFYLNLKLRYEFEN